MSDTTPTPPNPDATPTEALPLADQQPIVQAPVETAPAAAAARGSHTRTILEVIGGVVAAGLIVVAGAVGFAVGHATGDDDGGRWSMTGDGRAWEQGPEAGGPMGDRHQDGHGMGPGFERGQGRGPGQGSGPMGEQLPAPSPDATTSSLVG